MTQSFLALDCETNGLPELVDGGLRREWPRLVELSWGLFDYTGRELVSQSSLVVPQGFVVLPSATAVHGITTEIAISAGRPLGRVLEELSFVLTRADVAVAHNWNFDASVLRAEYARIGGPDPIVNARRVCTMEGSTEWCAIPGVRGFKWPSLKELYARLFNETLRSAHRAEQDMRACARCYLELIRLGVLRAS